LFEIFYMGAKKVRFFFQKGGKCQFVCFYKDKKDWIIFTSKMTRQRNPFIFHHFVCFLNRVCLFEGFGETLQKYLEKKWCANMLYLLTFLLLHSFSLRS